jgi:threonine aldolase
VIHYETGAVAGLAGCQVFPLDGPRRQFDATDVDNAIRPGDPQYPRTRLLLIENTHNRGGGSVWPVSRCAGVCDAARRHGLAVHLDGARLFNACAALNTGPQSFSALVDTVSVCFSKGLGAPVGSAVAGPAALLRRVRRVRKMFGGAMRQSGLLAAAAIHALDHHVSRLGEDHRRARRLAAGVAAIDGLLVDPESIQTNMVFFDLAPGLGPAGHFCERLAELGVLMLPLGPRRIRAVTHLDVDDAAIDAALHGLQCAVAATRRAAPRPQGVL